MAWEANKLGTGRYPDDVELRRRAMNAANSASAARQGGLICPFCRNLKAHAVELATHLMAAHGDQLAAPEHAIKASK